MSKPHMHPGLPTGNRTLCHRHCVSPRAGLIYFGTFRPRPPLDLPQCYAVIYINAAALMFLAAGLVILAFTMILFFLSQGQFYMMQHYVFMPQVSFRSRFVF